eukprot:364774-Chlamydomonas_euryale.AAC.7
MSYEALPGAEIVAQIQALHGMLLSTSARLEAAQAQAQIEQQSRAALEAEVQVKWEECSQLLKALSFAHDQTAQELASRLALQVAKKELTVMDERLQEANFDVFCTCCTAQAVLQENAQCKTRQSHAEAEIEQHRQARQLAEKRHASEIQAIREQHKTSIATLHKDAQQLQEAPCCPGQIRLPDASMLTSMHRQCAHASCPRAARRCCQGEVRRGGNYAQRGGCLEGEVTQSLAALQDGRGEQILKQRVQKLTTELKATKMELAAAKAELQERRPMAPAVGTSRLAGAHPRPNLPPAGGWALAPAPGRSGPV